MIWGSLVMWFANDFNSWLRHLWKSLANHLTRDPKIIIHGNSCIILYILHSQWYCWWWLDNTKSQIIGSYVLKILQLHITFHNFLCITSPLLNYFSQIFRNISNIRRTKSPNLTVYRLILQLSLLNPMKPSAKSRMKMELEQRRQAMLQLHLSDRQFYCLLRCDLY